MTIQDMFRIGWLMPSNVLPLFDITEHKAVKDPISLECPGSSMQMCFMACPSMPAEVFGACVGECAKRCDNP